MAAKTMNPDLANAVDQLGQLTGADSETVQTMLAQQAQALVSKAHARAKSVLRMSRPPRRYQGNRKTRKAAAAGA